MRHERAKRVVSPSVALPRLKRFAERLGWRGVCANRHVIDRTAELARCGQVIRWYDCGSYDDILLQINEGPTWYACVYAIPYRLCSGWHAFRLFPGSARLDNEADRLWDFLARDWFSSRDGRRLYRDLHPECTGYTWRRFRNEGTPHKC
jgi:hypothetical protein